MTTTRRPTTAAARRARIEAARAALARVQLRSRIVRLSLWTGMGAVLVVVIVTAIVLASQPDSPPAVGSGPTAASGTSGRTTNPPWSAPTDSAAAVAAAGLPMLGEEGSVLHIHAHLDVIVNGHAVPVPADIGVDEAHHQISPLHSHEANGVIHIESPTKSATFTLGQFFTEWQVSLSAEHIGGLVADQTHHLYVYVNGKRHNGDPTGIVLAAHDEIAIVYGTDAQQTRVPSSYHWTNGL